MYKLFYRMSRRRIPTQANTDESKPAKVELQAIDTKTLERFTNTKRTVRFTHGSSWTNIHNFQ